MTFPTGFMVLSRAKRLERLKELINVARLCGTEISDLLDHLAEKIHNDHRSLETDILEVSARLYDDAKIVEEAENREDYAESEFDRIRDDRL